MAYIGNRPVSGDNNSFRVLDDIKTHTFSFDGSSSSVVSTSNNTITHKSHRLVQGQRVTYTDGTGSAIGGLTDGTAYFIIINDANSFKLASSASNAAAGTGINLTAVGSGTAHNITVAFDGVNTKFKATFNDGTEADVTRVAQIQISLNNVIQQPQNTPTPTSGFGFEPDSVIVFASAPASNATFWGVLFANNFPTFEISDNDVDNFTGDGSKTDFTLSKSPVTNENIIVTVDGVVQYPSDSSTTRAYNTVSNTLQFSAAPEDGADIQARHIGFAGPDSSISGVTAFYGRTGNVFLNNSDNIVVNNAEVAGNLTVQGDTTTLNTTLRNVELLRVDGNDTVAAGIITQRGSGDILNLYDGSTEVFSVEDGGSVRIGDNASYSAATSADDLVIGATTGQHGLTILTGNNSSSINFADSAAVNPGAITYNHNGTNYMRFRVAGGERVRIQSGNVGINSTAPTSKLDVDGDVKITGIMTAASFVGGLPITNGADNRVITATSASAIQGESGLTYDGTYLNHIGSGFKQLKIDTSTSNSASLLLKNQQGNFTINTINNAGNRNFTIYDGTAGETRFRINQNGTVGIGTNNLTQATGLTVYRDDTGLGNIVNIEQDGTGDAVLGFAIKGTAAWQFGIDNSDSDNFKVSYDGSGLDSSTAVTLDRSGNVFINRTAALARAKLSITKEEDEEGIGVQLNQNSGITTSLTTFNSAGQRIFDLAHDTDATPDLIFKLKHSDTGAPTEKLRITSGGEVRIADGGLLTINADANGNYAVSEAIRIDDGNGTNDRALQIFEYHHNGGRWHSFNQNLHVTTTGTSYTYTQGNYGGSNMIQMINGHLRIFNNPEVVSAGTSAITPIERFTILSDGKVGVGQINPATTLEIKSDANAQTTATIPTLRITNDDGSASLNDITGSVEFFTEDSSDPNHISGFMRNISETNAGVNYSLVFGTKDSNIAGDATEKLRIQSNGLVGIGTNSPEALLHLYGSSPKLYFTDTDTNVLSQIDTDSGGGNFAINVDVNNNEGSDANFIIRFNQTAPVSAAKFLVNQSGNVGIGTGDPDAILHIHSSAPGIRLSDSDNAGDNNPNPSAHAFAYFDANAANAIIHADKGNDVSNSRVAFAVDNDEKMRIEADGNVGINTTNPESKLTVAGNSATAQIELKRTNTNASGTIGVINFTAMDGHSVANISAVGDGDNEGAKLIFRTTSAAGEHSPFGGSTVEALRIASNGRVGISTNDPQARLDVRDSSGLGIISRSATTQETDTNKALKVRNNSTTDTFNVSYKGQGYFAGNVGVGSNPDERLHVVVTSATATVAKFERSHNNNVSIEYRNTTSRMYAGLAGDALGWAVDDDANLGVDPMFMVRRSTSYVGVNIANPLRQLDVIGNSILVRPTATTTLHSSGNASAVNNSIIVRMPYGENAATTSNAGARFGIQFTGANNTTDISSLNFGNDPVKSASIYGVSEDSLGYNRKVGMAFYTSGFDAAQQERLRITNDGKVGIGTASPDGQLHISSGTSGDCRVYIEADEDNNAEGDNPFIIFKNDGGVENAAVWCGNADGGNDNSLNLSAATNVSGGIRFFTSTTAGGWETADERARITPAGQLLINESTARSYVDGAGHTQTPKLQVESDDNTSSAISLTYNSGGGAATRRASFMFARTADGSAVSNNSVLGEVLFMGEGNNTLEKAASIRAEVDNTPGTNDMPGRLIFSTSADGSDSPTEKLRISSDGLTTLENFNGTGLRLRGSGSDYQGVQLQVTDASATQTRNVFIDAVNENGNAVANMVGAVQADGGSAWSWQTQAVGNDRNDRRVTRLNINPDGEVGINSVSANGSTTITDGTAVVNFGFGTGGIPANAVGGIAVKVGDEQMSNNIRLPRFGCIMVMTGFSDAGGTNYPQPQASGMLYVDVGPSRLIRPMYTQGGTGADNTTNVGHSIVGYNLDEHWNLNGVGVSSCTNGKITILKGNEHGTIRICNRESNSAFVFYLTFL